MKRISSLIAILLILAACSLSFAQSSSSVGPLNQSSMTQGLWASGGIKSKGSISTAAIGTPSAPVVVVGGGTAGVTSVAYFCAAMDMNSTGLATSNVGDSIPSAGTTLTTSNATRTAANFNTITCGGQAGALGYKVFITNTSTFLGACNTNSNFAAGVSSGTSCSVNDTGQATAAYVPNIADQTGFINSAVGSNRSWKTGTSNAVVSNAVANFIALDGSSVAQPAATEGDVSVIVPAGLVFRNLTCALYTAAGVLTVAGGTNYVLAVRQNIATPATTPTCTIATAASSCQDLYATTGHSITSALLDQIDFIDTPSGTPTALVVKCTVEVDE